MSTEVNRKPRGSGRKILWGTTAFLGLLVLLATQLTSEVSWDEAGIYGILLLGAAGTCELVMVLRERTAAYREAAIVALLATFLLVWVNGAVGIIGNEDQPANRLYGGVVALGLIGSLLARFRPRGTSRALLAMAFAVALVPVIALIAWPSVSWGRAGMLGVFTMNAFFAGLFIGSAWLFRRAAIGEAR